MSKFKIGHHSSDFTRNARSEFERQQRAMQATIQRLGYDKVPLNDETLRPLLKELWNFGKAHNERVWTFDIPSNALAGRLFYGLLGGMTVLHPLSKVFQAKLLDKFSRAEVERAQPVFQLGKGGQCMLYFEAVWTPAHSLDGMKH